LIPGRNAHLVDGTKKPRRSGGARPRRPQGWPIRAGDVSGDTNCCDGSVTTITPLTTMGKIRASTKRSLVILVVALNSSGRCKPWPAAVRRSSPKREGRSSCSWSSSFQRILAPRHAVVGHPTEIEHEGLHTSRDQVFSATMHLRSPPLACTPPRARQPSLRLPVPPRAQLFDWLVVGQVVP
jgi:hypothetical protein